MTMPPLGAVKANRAQVDRWDEPPIPESVSLLQLVTRGDPPRVMMYVRYLLSLRNAEDLLFERGIDISHETVRLWWNRFGPLFSSEIRRQRASWMRGFRRPAGPPEQILRPC